MRRSCRDISIYRAVRPRGVYRPAALVLAGLLGVAALGGCASTTKTCLIDSNPSGADVFVDGEHVGQTPCHVNLRDDTFLEIIPDTYTIVVRLEGYKTASRELLECLGTGALFPAHMRFELTPEEPPADGVDVARMRRCDLSHLPETPRYISLAVFDFHVSEGLSSAAGEALADLCREAVQESRRFVPVDREDMKILLTEEDFAATVHCDDKRCLVDYGRKLRAQKVVHGRVNNVGHAYVLTLKLLDVSSAEIEALKTVRVRGVVEGLLDHVRHTTCELLHEALSRPEPRAPGQES